MESYRPKRTVVKKVLTYNINYHQIGYEQLELQRALKNSLLEAEAAKPSIDRDNDELNPNEALTDLKNNLNDNLTESKSLTDLNNAKPPDLIEKTEQLPDLKQDLNNIIDQLLNQPFEEDLPFDKNENSSFKVNTKVNSEKVNEIPIKKAKLAKNLFNSSSKKNNPSKSSLNNKKSKNDKLDLNFKDKFKQLEFESELLTKLKDVEKDLKQTKSKKCKSKSSQSSDQATNVFNSEKKELKLENNQLSFNNLDEKDNLDDHLDDNFDLSNLISNLIDKLDENNSSDTSDKDLDVNKVNETNRPISGSVDCLDSNLNGTTTMVSNKNLSSSNLSSSVKIKKELNGDKHPLLNNNHKPSKTNGHHLNNNANSHLDKLESQFNSKSSKKIKKVKTNKNVNKPPRKAKTNNNHNNHNNHNNNTTSLYDLDFDFDFDFDDDKSIKQDSPFDSLDDNLSSKNKCTNSSSSSSSSSSFSSTSCSPESKFFTIQNCIKNEIKKKILQKSIKLSKKNGTKTSLTNGNSDGPKKKKLKTIKQPKLNGTKTTSTAETNGKIKKKKEPKDLNGSPTTKTTKKSKDKQEKSPKIKKPRTPHLLKEPKTRKRRSKKELLKKSDKLIRNLYKFRQYLKIKKQELLNLDRNELSALNQISKELMNCCFVESDNYEVDFDIYDPLTVSGLMSCKPFSDLNSKSILSNELLNNLLPNLRSDNEMNGKTNGLNHEDSSTEVSEEDEDWASAPSSPV